MAKYYGIERSQEYLAHYGRPGQRKGYHLPDVEVDEDKIRRPIGFTPSYSNAVNKLQRIVRISKAKADKANRNATRNTENRTVRSKKIQIIKDARNIMRDIKNKPVPSRNSDPVGGVLFTKYKRKWAPRGYNRR